LRTERGERAPLSYCPGVALDLGEVYPEDASGLALVHPTFYSLDYLSPDEKYTHANAYPGAMPCYHKL